MASLVAFLCLALQQASSPPSTETLRTRLEQIHDAPVAVVQNVRLRQADTVVHFFEKRSFEPAWQVPKAAESIVAAITDAEHDGLVPADYHLTAINALLDARAAGLRPAQEVDLQILLTDAVATLIDHLRYGKVKPVTLDRRWNVDPRAGAAPLTELVAQVADARAPTVAIEALKPSHFIYVGLKEALAGFRAAARDGSWPTVAPGGVLKPGMSDKRVPALRRRLAVTGELASGAPAESEAYDEELVAAVKRFQDVHRLTADGAIGPATRQALNVTAEQRASQVRVNLERARWVLGGLNDSFVLVNLPAFKIYVIRDRKNVWESRTQIGREARQTPSFRADLTYLVINPDWTVPPTILAQDVLPGMRKGENTIARKKLTILDRQGRIVSPSTIDWAVATPRTFRYTLRQPPGRDNALGRVKFVFPNEHTVFLHDTPSQELFRADERTFSSGCIRVERALELANLLLGGHDGWSAERIDAAVEDGRTQTVFLEAPLPILIVYWTVSVSPSGTLRFARDVYKLDSAVLQALDARS